MSALQKRINELMLQKRITAVDIEKTTGLSRNTIYSILSGHSKSPSAHSLQLIARVLGVTLESLLTKDDDINKYLSKAQMDEFLDIARSAIGMLHSYKITPNVDQLTMILNAAYKYAIKNNPPAIDDKFFTWMLEYFEIN